MDLAVLKTLDDGLGSEDTAALRFLCRDHIPLGKLATVKDGLGLFEMLQSQGMLEDGGLFVMELLDIIGRQDLLQELKKSCKPTTHLLKNQVSSYRKMLYELSEDMTEDNLNSIKFLLKIPRARKTFLEVVVEMEKLGLLAPDCLTELERVCSTCNKQLAMKLAEFIMDSNRQQTNLAVRPQNSSNAPQNEVYDMSHRPRGICLIINNYDFKMARMESTELSDRRGTGVDESSLTHIFTKLHFTVVVQNDQTQSAILKAVKEFGQMDHSKMDAFVCCVLSHGARGVVYGTDGQLVSIRSITQPFTSTHCPSLATKPKLFFIQACQGNKKQQGVSIQADGEEDRCQGEEGHLLPDAIPDTIPDESDFLLGMATVEDCKSFRSITQGSIFIQELCRQLQAGCNRLEHQVVGTKRLGSLVLIRQDAEFTLKYGATLKQQE